MKQHTLSIIAIVVSTLSLAVSTIVFVSAKSDVGEKYATESEVIRNKEIADSQNKANVGRISGLTDGMMKVMADLRLLKEHTGYKATDVKN